MKGGKQISIHIYLRLSLGPCIGWRIILVINSTASLRSY